MAGPASEPPPPPVPRRNRTTKAFRTQLAALPREVQALARKTYQLFLANPSHPSLRRHQLADTSRGQHRPDSISVSVSRQYRAIYVEAGDANVWYWIGTHAEYNRFTGRAG